MGSQGHLPVELQETYHRLQQLQNLLRDEISVKDKEISKLRKDLGRVNEEHAELDLENRRLHAQIRQLNHKLKDQTANHNAEIEQKNKLIGELTSELSSKVLSMIRSNKGGGAFVAEVDATTEKRNQASNNRKKLPVKKRKLSNSSKLKESDRDSADSHSSSDTSSEQMFKIPTSVVKKMSSSSSSSSKINISARKPLVVDTKKFLASFESDEEAGGKRPRSPPPPPPPPPITVTTAPQTVSTTKQNDKEADSENSENDDEEEGETLNTLVDMGSPVISSVVADPDKIYKKDLTIKRGVSSGTPWFGELMFHLQKRDDVPLPDMSRVEDPDMYKLEKNDAATLLKGVYLQLMDPTFTEYTFSQFWQGIQRYFNQGLRKEDYKSISSLSRSYAYYLKRARGTPRVLANKTWFFADEGLSFLPPKVTLEMVIRDFLAGRLQAPLDKGVLPTDADLSTFLRVRALFQSVNHFLKEDVDEDLQTKPSRFWKAIVKFAGKHFDSSLASWSWQQAQRCFLLYMTKARDYPKANIAPIYFFNYDAASIFKQDDDDF